MRRLELQEAQDIWKLAKLHTNTHQSKAHSADVHKAKAKKKTQFRSPHGQEESEWVCDGPHLSFQLIFFFFFFVLFYLSFLKGPRQPFRPGRPPTSSPYRLTMPSHRMRAFSIQRSRTDYKNSALPYFPYNKSYRKFRSIRNRLFQKGFPTTKKQQKGFSSEK